MSTSKITLFKTDLVPTKYWKLDNIEDYLSVCTSEEVKGAKYLKPDLTNTIKLPKDQKHLAVNGLKFNYLRCCTTEDDGTIHNEYYFINNYDWGGKKGITLALQLDTLNTIGGTKMNDITQIIREHQDRWKKVGNKYYPIIDKYDEGLSPLKQVSTLVPLQQKMMYLVQISRNATTPDTIDTHPYDTYICYDDAVQFAAAGTGTGTVTFNNITDTRCFIITEGTITVKVADQFWGTYHIGDYDTKDGVTGFLRAFKVQKVTNGNVYVKGLYYTSDKYPYSYAFTKDLESSEALVVTLTNAKYYYYKTVLENDNYFLDTATSLDAMLYKTTQVNVSVGTYAARVTTKFSDFDRTNTAILGIYPVPYRAFTTSNATFVEGYNLIKPNSWDEFQVSSVALYGFESSSLPTSETKLLAPEFLDLQVTLNGEPITNVNTNRYVTGSNPYLQVKLTYDNDNPATMLLNLTCNQFSWLNAAEHYTYFTNRYNLPLFTNEWTEYVRNGYNYDAAEQQRERTKQGWNIGLNVAKAVLGGSNILPSVVKGLSAGYVDWRNNTVTDFENNSWLNYETNDYSVDHIDAVDWNKWRFTGVAQLKEPDENGDKVKNYAHITQGKFSDFAKLAGKQILKPNGDQLSKMVLNEGLNSVNSIASSVVSIQSSAAKYQYELNSKANAHTSISGSNNNYNLCYQKGLYLEYWKPEQYLLDNIEKVFYLTGYNHPVQEVPNTKSRKLFNYLQCIPTWTEDTINDYKPEFLNDLSAKYQSGVTIFHTSDLSQTGNNQEVNL